MVWTHEVCISRSPKIGDRCSTHSAILCGEFSWNCKSHTYKCAQSLFIWCFFTWLKVGLSVSSVPSVCAPVCELAFSLSVINFPVYVHYTSIIHPLFICCLSIIYPLDARQHCCNLIHFVRFDLRTSTD